MNELLKISEDAESTLESLEADYDNGSMSAWQAKEWFYADSFYEYEDYTEEFDDLL